MAEKRVGQKELAALLRRLHESKVLKLIIEDNIDQVLSESWIDSLRGKVLKGNEDTLDALICLYTAGLYAIGHIGQLFGDTDYGYVWVPRGNCI